MNNKVYYGEYTLKHWINMILLGNIILPDYQRTFVWEKENVIRLIESIKNDFFVPSITIGSYKEENLIIDGQQRLTSILLAYLRIYPKKEDFKNIPNDHFANDNDDSTDTEEQESILGWTFNELLKRGKSQSDILRSDLSNYECIKDDKDFKKLDINESFFENNHLGFSYLIPLNDQQKYFSSVFRNINENGKKLSSLETRKALYFLKDGMDSFFDPDCVKTIFIEKDKKRERIDFVRYLSIACQYAKTSDINSILKNFGKKEENYYSIFIDDFINSNVRSMFIGYDGNYSSKIDGLKNEFDKVNLKMKTFTSIIDCDIYMFGLVYHTVIKNKKIDETKKDELLSELESNIDNIKENEQSGYLHKKTPSALKYLRQRVAKSIEIYGKYVK